MTQTNNKEIGLITIHGMEGLKVNVGESKDSYYDDLKEKIEKKAR